ncbi:hypothetical protein GCM10009621_19910 [Corynebacterium felinum]
MMEEVKMRECTTDLHLLLTPQQWVAVHEALSANTCAGVEISAVYAQELSFACEPDNMLVTHFEQQEGRVPLAEVLHRVVVLSKTSRELKDLTVAIVEVIATTVDSHLYWYGTSSLGHSDPYSASACSL